MSTQDQAQAFLESITKAAMQGHGQAARHVGEKAIDLVCDGFTEAIENADICEGCKDKIGLALEPLVEHLNALKGGAAGSNGGPRPMCKGTPGPIKHACPRCGTYTARVEPSRGNPLELRCSKCQEDPEKCPRCGGRGWSKGTTPGGTRVVRVKCSECNGTGAR